MTPGWNGFALPLGSGILAQGWLSVVVVVFVLEEDGVIGDSIDSCCIGWVVEEADGMAECGSSSCKLWSNNPAIRSPGSSRLMAVKSKVSSMMLLSAIPCEFTSVMEKEEGVWQIKTERERRDVRQGEACGLDLIIIHKPPVILLIFVSSGRECFSSSLYVDFSSTIFDTLGLLLIDKRAVDKHIRERNQLFDSTDLVGQEW